MDSTTNELSPQYTLQLSEANLAQQNEGHVCDQNYANRLLEQEASQIHAQRLREEAHEVTACAEESCDHHEVVANDEDIAEVTEWYKPQKSSNALPMERMATMSSAEAPFAVGEKLEMERMGIERGLSAPLRHKAAVGAVGRNVEASLTYRRANSMTTTGANRGGNARVHKESRVGGGRKRSKKTK